MSPFNRRQTTCKQDTQTRFLAHVTLTFVWTWRRYSQDVPACRVSIKAFKS